MPEVSYLHIRTRDLHATRVLPLTGPSLRIGRGVQCELRLDDPELAEVHCLLRRRGESWYVQPVGPAGRLSIEGRFVEHQRPLPMGVVLRVGEHWLTLRPAGAEPIEEPAEPEYEEVAELVASTSANATKSHAQARSSGEAARSRGSASGDRPTSEPEVIASPTPSLSTPSASDLQRERLAQWEQRLRQRERWLEDRQSEKLWEARWRAAGQNLRSQSTGRTTQTHDQEPLQAHPTPNRQPRSSSPASSIGSGRGVAPSRFVPFVEGRTTKAPATRPTSTTIEGHLKQVVPSGSASSPQEVVVKATKKSETGRSNEVDQVEIGSKITARLQETQVRNDPKGRSSNEPLNAPDRFIAPPEDAESDRVEPREIGFLVEASELADQAVPAPTLNRSPIETPSLRPDPLIASEGSEESASLEDPQEESPNDEGLQADISNLPGSGPELVQSMTSIDDPSEPGHEEESGSARFESVPTLSESSKIDPVATVANPESVETEPEGRSASPSGRVGKGQKRRRDAAEPSAERRRRRSRRKLGVARVADEPNPAQPQRAPLAASVDSEPVVESSWTGTEARNAPSFDIPSMDFEDLVTMLSRGTLSQRFEVPSTPQPVTPQVEPLTALPEEIASKPEHVPSAAASTLLQPDLAIDQQETEASTMVEELDHQAAEEKPEQKESFWPSAQSILAARAPHVASNRDSSPRPSLRRSKSGPQPTSVAEPEHWKIPRPRWFLFPALLLAAGFGWGSVSISWAWAEEQRHAGQVADRLLGASGASPIATGDLLVMEMTLPEPSWWNARADHLYLRSVAIGLGQSGPDPAVEGRLNSLLKAARHAAPGHPGLRFALAKQGEGNFGTPLELGPSLGLSRDVVSLTWTGHQLLRAGKVELAREAYRSALDLASKAEHDRLAPPQYRADSLVRRYDLPHESLIGLVVRDMAEFSDWQFEDWSETLPDFAVAALAAGRILREHGSPDASRALEMASTLSAEPTPPGFDPVIHLAAGAEALALAGNLQEARQQYQAALDLVEEELDDLRADSRAESNRDRLRRCWALNLADLNGRLGDTEGQGNALRAAMISDPNDEITQQAIRAQLSSGLNLSQTDNPERNP